jgi:hypothetical protein
LVSASQSVIDVRLLSESGKRIAKQTDFHKRLLRKLESAKFSLDELVEKRTHEINILSLIDNDAMRRKRQMRERYASGALASAIVRGHPLLKKSSLARGKADMLSRSVRRKLSEKQRALQEYVAGRRDIYRYADRLLEEVPMHYKPMRFNAEKTAELRRLL